MNEACTLPDLTLTLDADGVIQKIVASPTLAREPLEQWRGRRWGEIIETDADRAALEKIKRVRLRGDPACFELRQRFPSGLELPMEYTTFSLGASGFIAIGRNLEAISELRARLALANRARERDYWKIREIETRYRALFDATTEAVALVDVADLKVIEANHSAASHLYLSSGASFLPLLSDGDRRALDATLEKVREQGRACGLIIQPTPGEGPWRLRVSLMNAENGPVFICQLAPIGEAVAFDKSGSTAAVIERLPEGFVIIDREGLVQAANGAFLELVQLGAETAATGRKLTHWLSSPGADANVVMSLIRKHGDLRRFRTSVEGELGQSTPVEITAVGDDAEHPAYFGLLIRDLRHDATSEAADASGAGLAIQDVDNRTLEAIVRMSTEVIERNAIIRALELSGGNRTGAARHLGLSRQSLHAKLKKYVLDQK